MQALCRRGLLKPLSLLALGRGARLGDVLEQHGSVGPPQGADTREILIALDGEIPQNDSNFDEPQPST